MQARFGSPVSAIKFHSQLPRPHVQISVGQNPAGFVHYDQISDVMIEKSNYDIKNLNMMQKTRELLASKFGHADSAIVNVAEYFCCFFRNLFLIFLFLFAELM